MNRQKATLRVTPAAEVNNIKNVLAKSTIIACYPNGSKRTLRTIYLTQHGDVITHIDSTEDEPYGIHSAVHNAEQTLYNFWNKAILTAKAEADPTGCIMISRQAACAAGFRHDEDIMMVMPPYTNNVILVRNTNKPPERMT